MEIFQQLVEGALLLVPTAVAILSVVVIMFLVRLFVRKQYGTGPGYRMRRQLVSLVISFAGLIVVIMVLPIGDAKQGQLLSLIGILLSAAIALSSATFVGNILAGMMLRAMRNFKPGSFIHVGEYFGRVSDRGLFHIEIQNEDRDLTTLPNLYLVRQPVKVIQSSGTIVCAELSLGYDLSRKRIRDLLLEAATATQLEDPFVQVLDLQDFAVNYRVAGLLSDVKNLISTRSRLREEILDALHRAGIEIVSPTFMNTRAIQPGLRFIPPEAPPQATPATEPPTPAPEDVAFDKANEAESIEILREKYNLLAKEIESAKESVKHAGEEAEKKRLQGQVEALERRRQRLGEYLQRREEAEKN